MRYNSLCRPLAITIVASFCSFAISCSREQDAEAKGGEQAWKRYIHSGSDLIVVADMDELRGSEWYSEETVAPRSQELSTRAGFSYNDINFFVIACDLDNMPSLDSLRNVVTLDDSGQPDPSALQGANLSGLNATVILQLSKPITWQQTEAAIDVFFGSVTNATVTKIENAREIIVTQSTSPMPLKVTLSEDGRNVLMQAGETAADEDDKSRLDRLLTIDRAISRHGPLRICMQTSGQMKKKILDAASAPSAQQPNDSTAVLIGTALKPFVSFEGLAVAMTPSDKTARVYGELEFGSEEHALEAEAAINNILVPLITLAMSQSADGPISEPLLQRTSTYVRGTSLELKATISPPAAAESRNSTN